MIIIFSNSTLEHWKQDFFATKKNQQIKFNSKSAHFSTRVQLLEIPVQMLDTPAFPWHNYSKLCARAASCASGPAAADPAPNLTPNRL